MYSGRRTPSQVMFDVSFVTVSLRLCQLAGMRRVCHLYRIDAVLLLLMLLLVMLLNLPCAHLRRPATFFSIFRQMPPFPLAHSITDHLLP